MKILSDQQKISILNQINVSKLDNLQFSDLVLYFSCAIGVQNRECQWEGLQALNRRLNRPTIIEAQKGDILRKILLGVYAENKKSLPTCAYSLGNLSQFFTAYYPNFTEQLVRPPKGKISKSDNLRSYDGGRWFQPQSTYVIVSRYWWPGNPNTRSHPEWYYVPQYFKELGFNPNCIDAGDFDATLEAINEATENDLVILNLQIASWPKDAHQRVVSALAASRPKAVGYVSDAWRMHTSALLEQYADVMSCMFGEASISNVPRPSSSCAITDFPWPSPKEVEAVTESAEWRTSTPTFRGSIEENNFPRLVWYAILAGRDDFSFEISSIGLDNMSARESYFDYVRNNMDKKIICNFGARANGDRIITGRFHETISWGRTLLQEWCPAASRFFVDGEHFLSFSTLGDLESLIDNLSSTKDPLEIGRKGREYASQHYTVERWYSHLCSFF